MKARVLGVTLAAIAALSFADAAFAAKTPGGATWNGAVAWSHVTPTASWTNSHAKPNPNWIDGRGKPNPTWNDSRGKPNPSVFSGYDPTASRDGAKPNPSYCEQLGLRPLRAAKTSMAS